MSRKRKETEIWFRFKFRDTPAGRMQIQRAADKLFRLACVTERGQYTEEEVVGMVKEALKEAHCRGQLVFTRADLNAALRSGATIETESSTDGIARVKIIWPESIGYLFNDEESDNEPDA